MNLLFQYVQQNTTGCEVGVWRGELSKEICKRLSPTKLYLIDPWIVRPDYQQREYSLDQISQKDLENIYKEVKQEFDNYAEVTIIRDLFETAAEQINKEELDWIYLDGDHSEVFKDLCIAYKKIKQYGYIIGNYFLWIDPITKQHTVKQGLDNFLKKYLGKVQLLTIHNGQFVIKKS